MIGNKHQKNTKKIGVLKPEERKELAESLNDFVKEKKEEFTERRQESKDADQSDEP